MPGPPRPIAAPPRLGRIRRADARPAAAGATRTRDDPVGAWSERRGAPVPPIRTMFVVSVTYRDWIFDVDTAATREAYARARTGGAEDCGCDPCRNFVAAREAVYPDEILGLFARLGVDPKKEGEAYWCHRTSDGLHHYAGWFHFIGSVISGPPAKVLLGKDTWQQTLVEIRPGFWIGFDPEANAPRLAPLRSTLAVQVEFEAAIPWVCDRPEPDDPSA